MKIKKSTILILTEEVNDYNQHGGYFKAWFKEKPTIEELNSIIYEQDFAEVRAEWEAERRKNLQILLNTGYMDAGVSLSEGWLTDLLDAIVAIPHDFIVQDTYNYRAEGVKIAFDTLGMHI